jgi:hypothetical protein
MRKAVQNWLSTFRAALPTHSVETPTSGNIGQKWGTQFHFAWWAGIVPNSEQLGALA